MTDTRIKERLAILNVYLITCSYMIQITEIKFLHHILFKDTSLVIHGAETFLRSCQLCSSQELPNILRNPKVHYFSLYVFIINNFGDIYILRRRNTVLIKCCYLIWAITSNREDLNGHYTC
jgi:hypothetical protein